MSSQRVQKIYEAVSNQVRRLGKYKVDFQEVLRWQGRTDDGKDAVVLDFTSGTWASENLYAIITAEPASDLQGTEAMKTQSHASGHSIDGSVRFNLYMEEPSAFTTDHARFQRDLLHHLRGQLGAPVKLWLTATLTQPEIDGVEGHTGGSVVGTETEWMIPYGMTYPGGV